MLNSKDVKIAYASLKTEIIDSVLYIVMNDGTKVSLPEYREMCKTDSSLEPYWEGLFTYENAHEGLLTFGIGDKYGYIHLATGVVLCEPKWNWVSLFHDGYATVNIGCDPVSEGDMAFEVCPRNGEYGLINYYFTEVIPPGKYDDYSTSSYLRLSKQGNRYCTTVKRPSRYASGYPSRAFDLNEGLPHEDHWFIVYKDGQKGIINADGKLVFPFESSSLYVLSRNVVIRIGEKIIMYTNDEAVEWDDVYVCISHDHPATYLIVKKNSKYAIVRTNGTFVSNLEFTFAQAKQLVDLLLTNSTIIGKLD